MIIPFPSVNLPGGAPAATQFEPSGVDAGSTLTISTAAQVQAEDGLASAAPVAAPLLADALLAAGPAASTSSPANSISAVAGERLDARGAAAAQRRLDLVRAFDAAVAAGASKREAAALVGVNYTSLWRYRRRFEVGGFAALSPQFDRSGRKPEYLPNEYELAAVRAVYVKLDESAVRERGLGSSRVTAYRLVAKSEDEQITPMFRRVVLRRRRRDIPPSWARLLETPSSVLDSLRDARSITAAYISTPRHRKLVDETGTERPLRAGTIFEADDGTFNFYAWIPWPFGGDRCSEQFGVKLARWQLLAVVDARSEFCPEFHVVARNLSSYRGEDSMALLGDTMFAEGRPELWRLERGSWESQIVRDALKLAGCHVTNAWHSKQKSAVERFFDRLWTPLSLIPGHVGRDRGRFKAVQDEALACQEGRRDPRARFLSLEAALPRVSAAIAFVNSEPIESRTWGNWVPQERYEAQLREHPLPRLDDSLRIFFAREQRVWTVRGCCVGGSVAGPMVKFPVWFQCPELWEFEGCRVKCFFDPYASTVAGTLVLEDAWRGAKPGHVIARDVPALDLPPQAVLADGWTDNERERSLAIRRAISKAVRTEARNWRGSRSSEARDGLGNRAAIHQRASVSPPEAPKRSGSNGGARRITFSPEELAVLAPPRRATRAGHNITVEELAELEL